MHFKCNRKVVSFTELFNFWNRVQGKLVEEKSSTDWCYANCSGRKHNSQACEGPAESFNVGNYKGLRINPGPG